MTSFSYKNCTVSDVMGMPNPGYRFNILNERAQPVLSLVFERKIAFEGLDLSYLYLKPEAD